MFCPKCGNQIPDGAAFCPKCGNKFANKPAPSPAAHAAAPAKPATAKKAAPAPAPSPAPKQAAPAAAAQKSSFNAMTVIPLILGVIALILAFQPWFSPSSSDLQASQYISNGANNLSSFFGGDSTAGEVYRLKSAYTMMEIGDYGKALSAYGQSGGEIFGMLPFVWAVPVIISVIGLIMSVVQKKVAVARIGFALLAVISAFAAFVSLQVSGPIFPGLCCIVSIATFITVGMAKKEA